MRLHQISSNDVFANLFAPTYGTVRLNLFKAGNASSQSVMVKLKECKIWLLEIRELLCHVQRRPQGAFFVASMKSLDHL